jgi:hypothetical protein
MERGKNVNQILSAILKAVLVTLVSTIAAVAVEKIRRYKEDRHEDGWHQPDYDDYERW